MKRYRRFEREKADKVRLRKKLSRRRQEVGLKATPFERPSDFPFLNGDEVVEAFAGQLARMQSYMRDEVDAAIQRTSDGLIELAQPIIADARSRAESAVNEARRIVDTATRCVEAIRNLTHDVRALIRHLEQPADKRAHDLPTVAEIKARCLHSLEQLQSALDDGA